MSAIFSPSIYDLEYYDVPEILNTSTEIEEKDVVVKFVTDESSQAYFDRNYLDSIDFEYGTDGDAYIAIRNYMDSIKDCILPNNVYILKGTLNLVYDLLRIIDVYGIDEDKAFDDELSLKLNRNSIDIVPISPSSNCITVSYLQT